MAETFFRPYSKLLILSSWRCLPTVDRKVVGSVPALVPRPHALYLNLAQRYLLVLELKSTPKKEMTLAKSCSSLLDHLHRRRDQQLSSRQL